MFLCVPVCRLDRQTQATTLVHQIFGGYLRSRGTDLPVPVAQQLDYNPPEQPLLLRLQTFPTVSVSSFSPSCSS